MEDDKKGGNSASNPTFRVADIEGSKAGQQTDPFVNVHKTGAWKAKQASAKFSQWIAQHHRVIFFICITIVILAVVIFAAVVFIPQLTKNNMQNTTQNQVTVDANASVDSIREECAKLVSGNDFSQVIACWQGYIDANENSSNERRAELLIGRADYLKTYYPSCHELADQIMQDLLRNEEINHNALSASAVMSFAYTIGDQQTAGHWRQIVMDRTQDRGEEYVHGQG